MPIPTRKECSRFANLRKALCLQVIINFKEIQSVSDRTAAIISSVIKCRKKDASDAGHVSIEFYDLKVNSKGFGNLFKRAVCFICSGHLA